jgi:phosphatidylglycerol:prolipoprotein diacylglycerol transferase
MIDGFALGPFYIRFYGIILMLGALAGGYLATGELRRRGYDPELAWDLLVYLIIGGVLGARLWHILTPPPSSIAQGFTTQFYLTHPLDALSIWRGGLGIPGAILGGLVALYFYTRSNNTISYLDWADIGAPSLALGQAIGRWGNFFNQELYGAPTNLPWKIFIDPAHRLAGFADASFYHPLFAYESLLSLANMFLLLWITRRFRDNLRRGDVFNVYLIVYPVIRFGLDFLRLDASQLLKVNINQTLMALVAIAAIVVLVWRHRGTSSAVGTATPPSPNALWRPRLFPEARAVPLAKRPPGESPLRAPNPVPESPAALKVLPRTWRDHRRMTPRRTRNAPAAFCRHPLRTWRNLSPTNRIGSARSLRYHSAAARCSNPRGGPDCRLGAAQR